MTTTIDLAHRHFTAVHGDITVIGTWYFNGQRHRPCLVLIRTGDERAEHTVPCIVTMEKAYVWSEAIGIGDPVQAARTAYGFTQALRLGDDRRQVIRIASMIHDHIGDMLHIPPHPTAQIEAQAAAVAELTMTNRETGQTREVVLRDV